MQLKEIRKNRGLTQKELAEMIGVNESTISRYEKGQMMPTISVIKRLTEALNVDYYTLIEYGPVSSTPLPTSSVSDKEQKDITISLSEHENKLIRDFAKLHGISVSRYIRNIVMERITNEIDTLTCFDRAKDTVTILQKDENNTSLNP